MPVEYKQTELENGLIVIAEIDPDAHSAAAGYFVRTGARDEEPAQMGVSHFLEHMMFKGTDRRTAEAVDRDFDDLGANHNAFTTSEMTAFYAHCLAEHLPAAEEILTDILRPSIRQEDFDAEKKVIIEEIAMYRDHPVWSLYERALEVWFGAHPLAHRVLGTDETVGGMKREDMLAYFQHRYSADNTVLALAGKLDFDAMVDRAREHCGGWARTGAVRAYPEIPTIREDFAMTSASVGRHYVMMVAEAPALQDERRYAAGMLAQILGDTEGSRFYWSLIETGIAEEAQAQFDGRDGVGDFIVYASCGPEDGERVADLLRQESAALVDSLDEDDLVRVRSKVATAAALQGELPGGRMRRIGQRWTNLGEYRSLEDELDAINAVTLADLRDTAAAFPFDFRVTGTLDPE
jgi:predicted Zn-dependent peptidase